MFDHSEWMKAYLQEEQEEAKAGKEYLLSLIPELKQSGALRLVVHYDGSGDSGTIESINAYATHDVEYDTEFLTLALDTDKINTAVCAVLSGKDIDWYNNSGGYGDLILNVEDSTITIENNTRVEASTYDEFEV